jgi:predicted secreted protein
MVDITNTDSPRVVSGGLIYEETLPTIVSPGDVDFSGVFGPDDASQILLQEAQDQGSLNVWTITLPNSRGFWTFSAYVSEIPMDVQYDKEVTFAGKLSISGPCIYTAGSSVSPRDRRAGSSDWFRLPLTVSNPPPTGFIRGTCFTNSILLEVLCLPLRKQCWMRRICPSVTIALGKKEYRLAFSMGSVIAHVNLGLSKKDFLAIVPRNFMR